MASGGADLQAKESTLKMKTVAEQSLEATTDDRSSVLGRVKDGFYEKSGSGCESEMCYNLRFVEQLENQPEELWSIRQSAVYYTIDMDQRPNECLNQAKTILDENLNVLRSLRDYYSSHVSDVAVNNVADQMVEAADQMMEFANLMIKLEEELNMMRIRAGLLLEQLKCRQEVFSAVLGLKAGPQKVCSPLAAFAVLRANLPLKTSVLAPAISLLTTRWNRSPWPRLLSSFLTFNFLIPSAAAQSVDAAINSDWKQRIVDMFTEILVSCAAFVPAASILVLIGGCAAALLWAEAEGILGFFMLLTAIVFAAIRPDGKSDEYIRLAVGLGYVMLVLAYCRVVMMQPKHKKALRSERRSRKYGRLFGAIATMLGVIATIIVMAFPGAREFWKGLTALHPIFALSLATPLSFFLCDLIANLSKAVNGHENEEIMLPQLLQLEEGQ
jgi:hypothetical protein